MLSKVVLLSVSDLHFVSEEAEIQENGRTFPEVEQPVPASQMRFAPFVQVQSVSRTFMERPWQAGCASNQDYTMPSEQVCLTELCKVPVLAQIPRPSSFYSWVNLVSDISEVIGSGWVRVQCAALCWR